MRIRIGPGGRLLSVVVVAILTLPIMQGGPVSAQFVGGPANSNCTPGFVGGTTVVKIDLVPGNAKNKVNVKSGGLVEIAICSEDADGPGGAPPTFNAPTQVHVKCNPTGLSPTSPSCRDRTPTSIPTNPLPASSPTAGATGFELSLHSCNNVRDVNGDGVSDLVCHFFVNRMDLNSSPTITLRGCCDTPEFEGANFINCEVDCLPSLPPDDCIEC